MARGDATVPPPERPRNYALPGGVGPSRGWYVWKKFDPDTWEVEVTRDPPGETLEGTASLLHHVSLPGLRQPPGRDSARRARQPLLRTDDKSRWGYVCHFQDELFADEGAQPRLGNPLRHARRLQGQPVDGQRKEARRRGNRLHHRPEMWQFPGRQARQRAHRHGRRASTCSSTWVWPNKERIVLLYADDASLDAIEKEELERMTREVASDGVAGHVEGAWTTAR